MGANDTCFEYHSLTEIFPVLKERIDYLAGAISAYGLTHPIEIYEGKILNGRHRHLACAIAGVEPETVDVHPEDPIVYIIEKNSSERVLNASQLGLALGRAWLLYKKEGIEKRYQDIYKDVQISRSQISEAIKLLRMGNEEMIRHVECGTASIKTALRKLGERTPSSSPNNMGPGIGIQRAHDAINCLKRIPLLDPFRERGLQIVESWIRENAL